MGEETFAHGYLEMPIPPPGDVQANLEGLAAWRLVTARMCRRPVQQLEHERARNEERLIGESDDFRIDDKEGSVPRDEGGKTTVGIWDGVRCASDRSLGLDWTEEAPEERRQSVAVITGEFLCVGKSLARKGPRSAPDDVGTTRGEKRQRIG